MSWVRLDDDFYQHPKVIQVGPLGLAMQVAALCYCNHNGTRGVLPYEIVPRLLSFEGIGLSHKTSPERPIAAGHDPDGEEIATWLVAVGMWKDTGDSYLIHDYEQYQLPESELSAKRAEAGRRGAEKRWQKGDSKSHRLATDVANGKRMALANPVPVPVPVPVENQDPTSSATGRARSALAPAREAEPLPLDTAEDEAPLPWRGSKAAIEARRNALVAQTYALPVDAGARPWYEHITGRKLGSVTDAALGHVLDGINAAHPAECVAWAFNEAIGRDDPWRYAKAILDRCSVEQRHGPRRELTNGRNENRNGRTAGLDPRVGAGESQSKPWRGSKRR